MFKARLSVVLLLLSCFQFLSAQDYQTIRSDRIAYFENQSNNVKSIRIDSVKFETDSMLYPFAVIQQLDYDCYSPYVASWIGNKVIVQENGINLYFNHRNDTIIIKTNAKLNDKWIAFQNIDSLSIEANITGHDTMSFLGLTDSVKTIGFQAYDKNLDSLELDINDMYLQISKRYGFVKTLNFFLFPDNNIDFRMAKFEEYALIGLSSPMVGIQNLTWSEVYDFQVGDVLHIFDESGYWDWDGEGYTTTKKVIYKYLERTDYEDSIMYLVSRIQSIYSRSDDDTSFSFYDDTISTSIKPIWFLDKSPGEPIITDWEMYNYHMTNDTHLSKTKGADIYNGPDDNCWSMLIYDICFRANNYIKGLGGPYYSCTNPFAFGGDERKLVYYKKGEITWGSPLVVTQISDLEKNNDIIVFPNPAQDIVTFAFKDFKSGSYTITIYDVNGKLVKSKKPISRESTINISELKTGVYIYKIIDTENVIKTDKLIIK